jgi:transcriptional regulator with XRE-family HTH domain
MNIIGINIRKLRQKNGWSQKHVAQRLHISIPALSKIETGMTDINISRLNQLADLFEVSVLDIICIEKYHPMTESNEKVNQLIVDLSAAREHIIVLQKKVINLLDENRELSKLMANSH